MKKINVNIKLLEVTNLSNHRGKNIVIWWKRGHKDVNKGNTFKHRIDDMNVLFNDTFIFNSTLFENSQQSKKLSFRIGIFDNKNEIQVGKCELELYNCVTNEYDLPIEWFTFCKCKCKCNTCKRCCKQVKDVSHNNPSFLKIKVNINDSTGTESYSVLNIQQRIRCEIERLRQMIEKVTKDQLQEISEYLYCLNKEMRILQRLQVNESKYRDITDVLQKDLKILSKKFQYIIDRSFDAAIIGDDEEEIENIEVEILETINVEILDDSNFEVISIDENPKFEISLVPDESIEISKLEIPSIPDESIEISKLEISSIPDESIEISKLEIPSIPEESIENLKLKISTVPDPSIETPKFGVCTISGQSIDDNQEPKKMIRVRKQKKWGANIPLHKKISKQRLNDAEVKEMIEDYNTPEYEDIENIEDK
jgi:hypothetical protein